MTRARDHRLEAVTSYFRMTRPASSIPELDGLRALAIVLVLFRHAVVPFRRSGVPLLPIAGWDAATPLVNGWMGVDLFFVLSGFLITHHIVRRYRGAFDRRSAGDYLTRRALRIVPAYYAVLLLAAAGAIPSYAVEGEDLGRRVLYHMLFMQDYLTADILVVFWSLGVEEKFYLLAPLLLVGVLRARRPAIQYGIIATVALLPTFFRWQVSLTIAPGLDYPLYFHFFRSAFHLSFDGLAMGMLCALLYRDRERWSWLRDARIASALFWTGAASTTWLLAATPLYDEISVFDEVYLGGVLALGMSGMLLGLALGGGPRQWFRPRGLFVISTLSYSLYLTHYALIPAVQALVNGVVDSAGTSPLARLAAFLPVYLAMSCAAAALLHYLVEKPFLMLRDRGIGLRLPGKAGRTVPVQPAAVG